MQNQNNEKLIEHYKYNYSKGRIGKGSYATVFRGIDINTQKTVAIKQIHKTDLQSKDGEEHLLNEINMLKRIRSPNIIEIVEVLQTSQHYYIILEYCNLGDLDSLLRRGGIINQEDHIIFVKDILNAFTTLIRLGVTHRDLKPANILVHQDGKRKIFKLADFGYAKTIHNYNAQILKSNLGTPAYMSPQLLREEHYTTKSDVWSFGIILYQIIYKKLPWLGSSEQELINKITENELKFPDNPKISTICQDFLFRCLQVNEEQRFCWDDVFRHPFVCKYFGKINLSQNLTLTKTNILLQSIREQIPDEQYLENCLKALYINQKEGLDYEEFSTLLKMLNKKDSFTNDDTQLLFNEFQQNNTINIKQFEIYLFYKQPKRAKIVRHLSNSNIKILQQLEKSSRKINKLELFNSFATKGRDALERHQFKKMVKLLANTNSLSSQNIKEIIDYFDDNGDGMIQYQEFNNVLKYVQQIETIQYNGKKLETISETDEMSFIREQPQYQKKFPTFKICDCHIF